MNVNQPDPDDTTPIYSVRVLRVYPEDAGGVSADLEIELHGVYPDDGAPAAYETKFAQVTLYRDRAGKLGTAGQPLDGWADCYTRRALDQGETIGVERSDLIAEICYRVGIAARLAGL